MKAEELAKAMRFWKIIWTRPDDGEDKDIIEALAEAIREIEQQARKEALERAATLIRDYLSMIGRGDVARNVYPMIRALIERKGEE